MSIMKLNVIQIRRLFSNPGDGIVYVRVYVHLLLSFDGHENKMCSLLLKAISIKTYK